MGRVAVVPALESPKKVATLPMYLVPICAWRKRLDEFKKNTFYK